MKNNKRNELLELSQTFAFSMVKICSEIRKNGEAVIADQLFRCSSSVGANVAEAQHSESRKDFIHKLKLAAKEASEAHYWMKMASSIDLPPNLDVQNSLILSIQKLLSAALSTCKMNAQNSNPRKVI